MKLRLRDNSLRLRLRQGEVDRVGSGDRVEETIVFGMQTTERLVYAIVTSNEAMHLGASFAANEVRITIPTAIAAGWATGDGVSLEAEQPIGDGRLLKILVEKDFACLKPRSDEDESEAYPNPSANG